MDKWLAIFERRFPGRFEFRIWRKENGQIFLRHGDYATFVTIYYGDRRPPIPLSGDKPVTETISDPPFSQSLLFK
jgi:hypothetical protein